MVHKKTVLLFCFLQIGIIFVGLKTTPYLIIGLPLIILSALYLIYKPILSLLLFNLSNIIKGFLTNQIPILEIVDFSILFTIFIWFGLIRLYLMGKWSIPNWSRSIIYIFFLFSLYVTFSVFFSPSPNYGLQKAFRFTVLTGTMFISPFVIIKNLDESERMFLLFRNILISIMFLMIFYILYYLSVSSGISLVLRISILGANPIAVGSFLAVAIGLLFVSLIDKGNNYIFLLLLLMILIISLISTGSRGPIISLLFGIIIYLLITKNIYQPRIIIFFGGVVFLILLSLFLLPENLTTRYLDYTTGDLVIEREGVKRVSTIAMRWDYWKISINEWSNSLKTAIFGIGSGGFSSFFILRDYRFYPHNIFLEVLLEFGLIGIVLFLLFWFDILKKIINNNMNNNSIAKYWFIAFIIRFIGAQFSGDLGGNRDMWLYLSMTLITIQFESKHINDIKTKKILS